MKEKSKSLGQQNLRIRGLKVENKLNDGKEFICRTEVVAITEDGVVEFINLVKALKQRITFSYVRIMGDTFENVQQSKKIVIGQRAFEAIMEGFATGLFFMTYEFRIYNFKPEVTPLLAYVDSLVGNQSLQTIGFARNGLNEDLIAAIL